MLALLIVEIVKSDLKQSKNKLSYAVDSSPGLELQYVMDGQFLNRSNQVSKLNQTGDPLLGSFSSPKSRG